MFLPSSSSLLFLNQQNIINILIIYTMSKTINIDVPEGFEIDTEESNLTEGKIVFKKKETSWRKNQNRVHGYYVETDSSISSTDHIAYYNTDERNINIFATEEQAKSMLAMAQLSQIIANDKRFGGPITDEEWLDENVTKYVIDRHSNRIRPDYYDRCAFRFLAFHTREQRDLFLKENEDLIKQYFML